MTAQNPCYGKSPAYLETLVNPNEIVGFVMVKIHDGFSKVAVDTLLNYERTTAVHESLLIETLVPYPCGSGVLIE